MSQNRLTDDLELVRKNPSRDGEAYRGIIDGRDTLVKVVTDEEERRWLRHEATVLKQLEDSPHVPTLYNTVEDLDKSYLAEEFVAGTSLESVLGANLDEQRNVTPLSPIDAAGIVNRIGSAEQDLLNHGVMYRDLQPAHIVFAADDRRAVFVDLGLASTDTYTDTQGIRRWKQPNAKGIYATMSPNELRGEDMSEADVVYRLAVIYHTTLTGSLPFEHPKKREDIQTWIDNPTFSLSEKLTPEGRELFENALYGDQDRQIKSIELFLHHMNRLKLLTIQEATSSSS